MSSKMDPQQKGRNFHETLKYIQQITEPGISNEQVMAMYSEWAAQYDLDMSSLDRRSTRQAAEELSMVLAEKGKDVKILDCAAGTGLCGIELKKMGYTNIDALDASAEMLEQAKKKGVYKRYIKDFMGPNRLDVLDDSYDGLVAVGCFCAGHVGPDCFEELIRITKPGGYIVLGTLESHLETDYKDELEAAMQGHHDNHKWTMVTRKVVSNYINEDNGVFYHFKVVK